MRRGTVGPDGLACEAGEVYDLPDAVARHWIAIGRAVLPLEAPHEPAPAVTVVYGDPVVATRPGRSKRTR